MTNHSTRPEPARSGIPARTALQAGLADHDSPFIFNQWYVAGLSADFGNDLTERTLLDRSLVFWRTADGKLRAFQNRCAHRAFPLAKSWREGDAIRCRYHGAKYDADGTMIEVPCQAHCPQVRLRTYPVVEHGPFAWIWMGTPAAMTPAPAPDFLGAGWALSPGYHHMQANYLLMTENLMDLSHLPFLHRDTFNYPASYAAIPVLVETDGFEIRYSRPSRQGHHRSLFFKPEMDARLDREPYACESFSRFVHQGFVHGEVNLTLEAPAPGEQALFRSRVVHLLTPETRRTTHYWFTHTRDFDIADDAYTARIRATVEAAFLEDMEAVRLLQQLHDTDRHPYREVHFAGDKPTVTMRRIVRRMIDLEQGDAVAGQHAD